MTKEEYIRQIAIKTINIELEAITDLKARINQSFIEAVNKILECKGHVVFCGMGKSGIIARKIAATFSSTGTPAIFIHPAEAAHGDLGIITKEDIIILVSNSGETREVIEIIPVIRMLGNTIIAMVGNVNSTIAKESDIVIDISVKEEACPLKLAPTSSTTATLVMGDAIAVALIELRNFKEENFALFHPGGSLGKRLLTRVRHVMHRDIPSVNVEDKMIDVVHRMSSGRLGCVVVFDNGKAAGIITDGDLRRFVESNQEKAFYKVAGDMMSKDPKTINQEELASVAIRYMNENKITSLIVIDERNNVAGIVHMHDLLKLGIKP